MTTLAIENDWDIPADLCAFTEHHPELVGEVVVLANARTKHPDDIRQMLASHNQFLIASTFIYKDQLEALMNGFASGAFGEGPFIFYVDGILSKLEQWTEKDEFGGFSYLARMNFEDHARFIGQLNSMLVSQKMVLYDINIQRSFIDTRTGKYPVEMFEMDPEDREEFVQNHYPSSRIARVVLDPDGTYHHDRDFYGIPEEAKANLITPPIRGARK